MVDTVAPRKPPVQKEWRFQEAVSAFLSRALPFGAWWSSIDQGRAANARMGGARRARGIHPGVPDMLIAVSGVSLWIELKAGSSLSPAQVVTRDLLVSNGHKWALARTLEDVEAACRDAGIPLRASLGTIRTRIEEQNARLPPKPKRAAPRPREDASARAGKAMQARAIARGIFT